jgi:hypothetical protein
VVHFDVELMSRDTKTLGKSVTSTIPGLPSRLPHVRKFDVFQQRVTKLASRELARPAPVHVAYLR